MVQGTLQLGVTKRPQGESLPCAKLRGFFYAGHRGGRSNLRPYRCEASQAGKTDKYLLRSCLGGRRVDIPFYVPATPNSSRHYSTSYDLRTFAGQDDKLLRKRLCCTEWNRALSTTKSRTMQQSGAFAGTAKKQCPGSGDHLRPGTPEP